MGSRPSLTPPSATRGRICTSSALTVTRRSSRVRAQPARRPRGGARRDEQDHLPGPGRGPAGTGPGSGVRGNPTATCPGRRGGGGPRGCVGGRAGGRVGRRRTVLRYHVGERWAIGAGHAAGDPAVPVIADSGERDARVRRVLHGD